MTRALFVVSQHNISHPDVAWPAINERLALVAASLGATKIRLPIRSMQELHILDPLAPDYRFEFTLMTPTELFAGWQPAWVEWFVDLLAKYRVNVMWFKHRIDTKQGKNQWYLDGVVGAVVIRDTYDQGLYPEFVHTAWSLDIPLIRIDPESYKAFKVNKPRKEG